MITSQIGTDQLQHQHSTYHFPQHLFTLIPYSLLQYIGLGWSNFKVTIRPFHLLRESWNCRTWGWNCANSAGFQTWATMVRVISQHRWARIFSRKRLLVDRLYSIFSTVLLWVMLRQSSIRNPSIPWVTHTDLPDSIARGCRDNNAHKRKFTLHLQTVQAVVVLHSTSSSVRGTTNTRHGRLI